MAVRSRGAWLALWFPVLSCAAGLPSGTAWVAAAGDEVPSGSVNVSEGVAGPAQYVCRARVGSALLLGRLSAGMSGCSVGVSGREFRSARYEVLVVSAPKKPGFAKALQTPAAAIQGGAAVVLPPPVGPAPRMDPNVPVRKGLAEDGRPYVEQARPDGSLIRQYPNGSEVTDPTGNKRWFPNMAVAASAQPPTPPELPADPARGRLWFEEHNKHLLELIAVLVRDDAASLDVLRREEAKDAGADLFKQVRYRTRIAVFFAREGSR
jgi:hypothetical protein